MGGGKRKSLKPFNVDQSGRIKRFEVFALLREKKGEYKCGGAVTVVLRYSLITTGPEDQASMPVNQLWRLYSDKNYS